MVSGGEALPAGGSRRNTTSTAGSLVPSAKRGQGACVEVGKGEEVQILAVAHYDSHDKCHRPPEVGF